MTGDDRHWPEDSPDGISDPKHWFTYAIGAVVISASHLDVAMGTLYAVLLDSDIAAAVAYGQPFSTIVQACGAALDAKPQHPTYDAIREVLKEATRLYEQRNQIAHGFWQVDATDPCDEHSNLLRRKWGKTTERRWTQRELMMLAGEILDASHRVSAASEMLRLLPQAPDWAPESDGE